MNQSREIVFIDSAVPDLNELLEWILPGVDTVVLPTLQPALAAMATALRERRGLDAIHVIAHGQPGEISFASGALSLDTLDEALPDLDAIGDALGGAGKLLLWSCSTAQGERGSLFLDALAYAVGAPVAAATGLVGSAERGGQWDLDAWSGAPGARAPLTSTGRAAYAGILGANKIIFDLNGVLPGVNGSVSYVEQSSAIFLAANATVSASGNFAGLTLTVSGMLSGEVIGLAGGDGLTISGNTIYIGGKNVATFSGETGTNFVVSFTNQAAAAEVATVLHRITYYNSSDSPVTHSLTFDLAGIQDTDLINITPVNDGPLIGDATLTGAVTEQTAPAGDLSSSGRMDFTDLDLGDIHTVSAVPVGTTLGTMVATKTSDTAGTGTGGALTWTYTVADSAVEYLAAGETKIERFTVSVDDGHGGLVSRTVAVTIAGTNDAPVITSNGGGASASISVAENTALIGVVTATDVDHGATQTYTIVGGADAHKFTINAQTGALSFVSAPDFDAPTDAGGDNVYDVIVQVSDGTATDTQAIAVTVTNLNDNDVSAVTDSNAAVNSVAENAANGTIVGLTAFATDADSGAVVTYSLSDNAGGRFAINTSTGEVTVANGALLNYETATSHSITVLASSSDGSSKAQTFTVAVNNLDEVAPTITSGATATAIDENTAAGHVVYTATSTDSADISGGVTYSLKAGGDAAAFSIDASSGAVTLTGSPNYETLPAYTFTVVAKDAAGNSSEQAVTLGVNNLDEVAPTITSGDTATAIDENTAAGHVVYTATSTDSADISGGVTYSLKAGGDAAAFSIDASSGAVTLTGSPDYETLPAYTFTVVAKDAAGNSSEQAVTLGVNNLDEVAPTITSGATATAIDENTAAGHVVYTATSTDSADISGGVTYSLKAGGDAAAFSIDASSGAVTLTGSPDYETLPAYTFTVVAKDAAGNSSEQAVTLGVNNLDEVAPTITSGDTATAIDENTAAGHVVYTATSTDSADISGGVTYSLKAGGDAAAFSIDASSGAVTLTGSPDYETLPAYTFTVVAKDAAGNSSEQAVSLGVNNLDEVAPTITSGATATAIDENTAAGHVVYTATSTDSADISGGVTYSLKAGGDAAAFSIDASSGAVTLTGSPDYETLPAYTFTVVAKDAAGNSSEQAVTLGVNNLDEVAPTITSGDTATAIDENTAAGHVVYTATSTDSADISGGVTYSLKAGGDAAAFSIDASSGAVTLTGSPDYETLPAYTFTVVAKDAAGNSSEQAVTLGVNNLDEVAPTITSGDTATAIDENTAAGHVVYTATSTDSADISGGVTYSLKAGGDAAAFSIDASSGAVTLTGSPDYETLPAYTFTVVAKDAAGNSSEQAVTLGVNNLDEVAPTITSGATATAIDENTAAGHVVYTATSTDSADISGGVTYSLKAGGDAAAFSIDASSGAVTLTGSPNYETLPAYTFTVVAKDAAGNSSEQAVSLGVNNLDEVAPTITSGSTATAIDENTAAGHVVYTATSTDSADISGGVTYSLKAGGDAAAFSIDASSGAVTLTGSPDYETLPAYTFTVVAKDAAGNSSEQAVTLGVNNLDEVAPTITSGATATAIDENTAAGHVVYTATSTDSADISGGVTYSLKAGGDAAAFSIDASSGAVTLTGSPNYETLPAYTFTVVAKDAAGNSSEQAVTLGVNNLDEVAPTITSGDTATAIDENTAAGHVVYTATSTDSADISGGVTYSLKAGGDAAAFSIDASSGAVTLTGSPDYETLPAYTFTVVAKDAAGNSSEQAVTLCVNNLDEVAPTITSGDTATAIDENTAAGHVVYTATSTDSADISGGVTYSLKAGGDAAAFSIDASSGAVTLTGSPDYETLPAYTFTVVAKDAAGNSSEQAVTLGVNNLDEVAPTITSGATATAIDENTAAGHVVYTATSTDSADISGGVTYSLKAGGDAAAFSIDASSGAVTLTGSPNYETLPAYTFTVVAKDAAGNSSEQAVSLGVNNLDEVAPTITSGSTATAIDENTAAGHVVYTATSTDSADISGGVTYSLKAGGDAAAFSIDASSGAVTLTGSPDYETLPAYTFTVVAKDAAGNSSEQAVTLGVNNLDEVAPTITSGATATAIDENTAAGHVVYTATSTDSADISGGVTYSLKAGGDAAAFSIDASSGAVTLTGSPDYETLPAYTFTVVAKDAAGNSSEQAVTLGVNNLDEVAPTITSGSTATAIDENTAAGHVVYTATSTDSADISGGVTYSLKAGGDAAAFSIDASSGAVTLTGSPDYETLPAYTFTVVAKDAAGNSSEQAVTLGVNNLDEVAPTITSGATATAIDENTAAGHVVYTATSTDSADISGGVTYSLKAGGDAAAFSIDASSGAVTLTGSPNYETLPAYTFTVVAKDAAGNSSEQAVTLGVNNLDEVAPTITSGATATAIDENTAAGHVVYTATSTDSADISGGVTYSLKAGGDAAAFSIDASSGAVTLTGSPNYETLPAYTFTVVAKDAAGNSSEQAVTLGVNNLDEVAPTITSGDTATAIDENTAAGHVVYTATSTDSADISGGVTYSLKAGGDAAAFSIDASSGAVTLTGSPNFEAKSGYTFTVVAKDAAGNSSEQAVSLAVNDLDEIAPTVTAVTDNVTGTAKAGQAITFTVSFSEAVTGVTETSFTATNGIVAGVTRVGSSNDYTVVVNPTAGVAAGTVALSLATGVRDTAGNAAAAGSLASFDSQAIDTLAPSAPTAVSLTSADGTVVPNTVNGTNTTLNASATIIAGQATGGSAELYVGGTLVATDATIANGDTTVTFTTSDGTPTSAELQAKIATGGLVTVKLIDAAGNATSSSVGNPTLIADYSKPTVTGVTDDVAGTAKAGQVINFIVSFSEAVTGVARGTFTATNGTVTDVQRIGTGNDYKVVVSPTADVASGTVALSLATGVTDTAGNAAVPVSLTSQSIDTKAPTATISISGSGSTKTATITFSEAVTNFDASDIQATGANLGTLTKVSDTVYTVPLSGIGGSSPSIQILASGSGPSAPFWTDSAGNAGVGSAPTSLKPAGIAGEPINLGLTVPSAEVNGEVSLTVTGLPADWTLNSGTRQADGSWIAQVVDPATLTVTTPSTYAGAMVLTVTQHWVGQDGSVHTDIIADNVEAYSPGSPIFALSADDTLTGSSGADLFVFAQPIATDTVHNFDAAADKIDLIGFDGFTSFAAVQAHLAGDARGNAVLTLNNGATITVIGVNAAALSASNFVFNQEPVTVNSGTLTISDGAIMPFSGVIENSGTIALASTGSDTSLEILVHSVKLQGGGDVRLSDSSSNIIFGGTAAATFTNVDNTISGAGQLGNGQMTLANAGTILANGAQALVIDTGSHAVTNTGTLEATGSGGLVITGALDNAGSLWANGGNVTVHGDVGGNGSATISGTATLEFGGSANGRTQFADNGDGTLVLDHSLAFTGTVAGFNAGDSLVFGDLFGDDVKLAYSANATGTGGTLILSDGAHTASVALEGQYTSAGFHDLLGQGNVNIVNYSAHAGDQLKYGSGGDDLLAGGTGNDILVGGGGDDVLTGGLGNDTFDFNLSSDAGVAGDLVADFSKSGTNGADVLDLHDLLQGFAGYDGTNAFTGGYLKFTSDGTNTVVQVDSNGGGDSFTTLVTLNNVLITEADTPNYFI